MQRRKLSIHLAFHTHRNRDAGVPRFIKKAPGALFIIIMTSFYPLFETVHTVSRHSVGSFFIFIVDAVPHYFIVSLLFMTEAE